MSKPKPFIKVLLFSIFLSIPRILLVVAQLLVLVIPALLVWGAARKWNNLDKKGLLLALQHDFKPDDSYVSVAIILVVAGMIFYAFKKYQRLWYGVIETMVALVGCLVTAQAIRKGVYQAPTANALLFQGFGAIYLLVRGLSNIEDGLKYPYWFKEDKEEFVTAYKRWGKIERFYRQVYREGRLRDENGKITRPPDKWED